MYTDAEHFTIFTKFEPTFTGAAKMRDLHISVFRCNPPKLSWIIYNTNPFKFQMLFYRLQFHNVIFLAKYNYLVARNSTGNSGATRKHMLPEIQRAANRHIK